MLANGGDGDQHPDVWLVRHGETEWARLGRHTGRTDVPLTELGREQARSVASRLAGVPFALVLSSPLSRAFETALLAGFGDQVEPDPDLVEWDYGMYEGRTTSEIRSLAPGWSIWREGPVGGETIDDVAARTDRVIARARSVEGNVLLVAHGHVLRVLAARWLGLAPSEGRLFALSTATVSVLGWEHGAPVIVRWNERCGGG
jgi:broad specificity phosphatase PhoE